MVAEARQVLPPDVQVLNLVECLGWSALPLGLCLIMKRCKGTLMDLINDQREQCTLPR